MNIIPEVLSVAATIGVKLQLTPGSIAMLAALIFCLAVVWRWAKGRV